MTIFTLENARKALEFRRAGASMSRVGAELYTAGSIDHPPSLPDVRCLLNMAFIAEIQEQLPGLTVDGWCFEKTQSEVLRAAGIVPPGMLSEPVTPVTGEAAPEFPGCLQERALLWCLKEAGLYVSSKVPDSRIAQYLRGCERDKVPGHGDWLADTELKNPGKDFSFCAAAQGFAEHQVAYPEDVLPPWRSGVWEMVQDAQSGRRPGEEWVGAAQARRLARMPRTGDLAIYKNGETWHVRRVWMAQPSMSRSDVWLERHVGANELGGKWVRDAEFGVRQSGLLGYIMRVL